MRAMMLEHPGKPLRHVDVPVPEPGLRQVLVEVAACAVCRTDLHVVDGELPHPRLPLIPGHEVVGRVVARGAEARRFALGARVGMAWLGSACGTCPSCESGLENLCEHACFTGYQMDGGYAEHAVADESFCFALPFDFDDVHAAPLMCAGLIGYRALKMAGNARRLGIYGFGSAAHIITQVALHQGRAVLAFTRPGDDGAQQFARVLGASWAGDSVVAPPDPLDAAIIFAPVGALVPLALRAVRPAGVVVCAGIHMSDIPSFPYRLLWGERVLRSVANLTRADGDEFLRLAPEVPVKTTVRTYPLQEANTALQDLRTGNVEGAAVLVMRP